MFSSNIHINQAKRQVNEDVLSNEETKKLRRSTIDKNDKAITCIEHLSNEIFYEIFDYLDGCDIFNAFSKLNIRFHYLVIHSSLPIKIYRSVPFGKIDYDHYEQFIIPNKHRIISFHTHNISYLSSFFPLHPIDESFNRLESLVLYKIRRNTIISLLRKLTALPHFFSLKISLYDELINFAELYGLIFDLPVLKYNKLSVIKCFSTILLPYNTDKFSSIEHLAIDYACSVRELAAILSYTPRLRHLTCDNLTFRRAMEKEIPSNIFNLRHVSINTCNLTFNEFEILFKKTFSQIRVLRFVTSDDSSYLDAHRWERLILRYMSHLRILDFKYYDYINHQPTINPYHSILNRFVSSFWIQRKWFFELKICIHLSLPPSITYSIQPFKKQWYELQDYMIDDVKSKQIITCSTLAEQKCINTSFSHLHLIIENSPIAEYHLPLEEYIYSIITLIPFTNLHIDLHYFSISILIQFLRVLPNLDSLTITSKFPEETKILSEEQINMFRLLSMNNKITKVNLEKMTELDQVHILMELCSHMRDLQVKCRNNADVEWLIRYVLKKRNTNFIPYLCSICLWISEANEEMMNNLQIIIDTEKLVHNYKINRICDKIYLRWNEHL